jgi:tuftelin-interacting protein 11
MANWAPFTEPNLGAQQFAEWRPLLETEQARNSVLMGASEESWGGGLGGSVEEEEDPYAALVNAVIVPKLRSAVTGWEPRQPEVLMGWLDVWEKLLPWGCLIAC